jgi:hypothetical protein
MILENCLVGCKEHQHHAYCESFRSVVNIEYALDEVEVESNKNYNLDMYDELEEVIQFYKLKTKYNSGIVILRHMFIDHCINTFKISEGKIMYLLDTCTQTIKYSKVRHSELKYSRLYIEETKEISDKLNEIHEKINIEKLRRNQE